MKNLRQTLRNIVRIGFKLMMVGGVAGVLTGSALFVGYLKRAQEYDLREIGRLPQRSIVYDGTGKIEAYMQGENRFVIPLSEVPKHFVLALTAQEDARFWEHSGIDYYGIGRAAVTNFREGAVRQGGSTLTQQLARNAFNLRGRSYDRKLLEAMIAVRIENAYPKLTILEDYVNRVYFGAGAYGIQRAAQVYFRKNARDLTLSESALLVALVRSPNRLSPTQNPAGAKAGRDWVIDRMVTLGIITPERAQLAMAEPLGAREDRYLPSPENYVIDAVRRDLEKILTREQIELGGLRIYTTIDPALQALAEKSVAKRMTAFEKYSGWKHPRRSSYKPGPPDKPERPTRYLQAALIAIDNRNGAIRALVGGRDYSQSRYDRANAAKRQVGSTFKPFIYAMAFERGMLPGSLVDDSRIRPGEFPDIPKKWSPDNADAQYGGPQPAAYGLIKSRNTMSVRVGEFAGLQTILKKAVPLGLGDRLPPYPAIFLGGFEATLRDLTTAYTIFPNGGKRVTSHLISRVEDASGRVLYQVPKTPIPVISPASAVVTSQLLQEVMQFGTAVKAGRYGLTKAAGGKTGTSNNFHDAWFVGYTRTLTCGVWVGLDKPKPIMAGGYGGTMALPVWVDVIQGASEKTYPSGELHDEVARSRVVFCTQSNALASIGCQQGQFSYVAELPNEMIPKKRCTMHDHLIPVMAAIPVDPPAVREEPPSRSQSDFNGTGNPRKRRDFSVPPGATIIMTPEGPQIIRRARERRVPPNTRTSPLGETRLETFRERLPDRRREPPGFEGPIERRMERRMDRNMDRRMDRDMLERRMDRDMERRIYPGR